jgi:hypothetical protein
MLAGTCLTIGLDDTDTREHPGTNKLAFHLARLIAGHFRLEMIVRHQLLEDPRVPCTNKNGCAALVLRALGTRSLDELIADIRRAILDWIPVGSDPGLCVATAIPEDVVAFGQRCQRQLITQAEARQLAARHGIYLEGLAGTQDGVIGALAAVGLVASRNDGRVIQRGPMLADEIFDIGNIRSVDEVYLRGVDEVRCIESSRRVDSGRVDLGKRLRPNLRQGRVVLFVSPPNPTETPDLWHAVRRL